MKSRILSLTLLILAIILGPIIILAGISFIELPQTELMHETIICAELLLLIILLGIAFYPVIKLKFASKKTM